MPRRGGKIPGVTGRRIPGTGTPRRVGGFTTRVPFIKADQGGSAAFREYHRRQIRDIHGRFAGGWGFAWIGLQSTDEALYDWADKTTQQIRREVEALADEMRDWMQDNAPWTDITGDARRSLQARVVWQTDNHTFTIFLGHGEDIYYGVWLEVRWGGRYAILQPTAEYFAPRIAGRIKAAV